MEATLTYFKGHATLLILSFVVIFFLSFVLIRLALYSKNPVLHAVNPHTGMSQWLMLVSPDAKTIKKMQINTRVLISYTSLNQPLKQLWQYKRSCLSVLSDILCHISLFFASSNYGI